MSFEGGPLSSLLADRRIRSAAAEYVTIRVDVPEAYVLLEPYDTMRPSLLVVDADGRHVAGIRIAGRRAGAVAEALEAARETKPVERFVLEGDALEALADGLDELDDDVDLVDASDDRIEVWAPVGTLTPWRLGALMREAEVEARLVDPVPLRVTPPEGKHLALADRVPGVWFRRADRRTNVWVCRSLLRPEAFAQAGLPRVGLVSRRERFPGMPKGTLARRLLLAALEQPGVLSVVGRLSDDTIEIVGRRGSVDLDAVRRTLDELLKSLREGPPAGG